MAKAKKPKKMTLAELNKALKMLGKPPMKRVTKATIKAARKKKAKALPLEHRQLILDLLHKDLTLGQVAEQGRVDRDTVLGVMELNTDQIPFLRKESR